MSELRPWKITTIPQPNEDEPEYLDVHIHHIDDGHEMSPHCWCHPESSQGREDIYIWHHRRRQ